MYTNNALLVGGVTKFILYFDSLGRYSYGYI